MAEEAGDDGVQAMPSLLLAKPVVDAVTAAVGVEECAPGAGSLAICQAMAGSLAAALGDREWFAEPEEEGGAFVPSAEDVARFQTLWPHAAAALRASGRFRDGLEHPVPVSPLAGFPPPRPMRSQTVDRYALRVRMCGVKWLVAERPARRPCVRVRGVDGAKLDFRFPKWKQQEAWEGSKVKEVEFEVRSGDVTRLPLALKVELYELRKVGSGLGTLIAATSALADASPGFVRRESCLQDRAGAILCRASLDVHVVKLGTVVLPPPTPPEPAAPPQQRMTQTTPRLATVSDCDKKEEACLDKENSPPPAHANASADEVPAKKVPEPMKKQPSADSTPPPSSREASLSTVSEGPGETESEDAFSTRGSGAAALPIPADPWGKLGDVISEVNRTVAAVALVTPAEVLRPRRKNKTPLSAHTAAQPCFRHLAQRVGYALELYLAAGRPPAEACSPAGSARRASALSRKMSRGGPAFPAAAVAEEELAAAAAQQAELKTRAEELEQWEGHLLARERAVARREELLRRRVPQNLAGMVNLDEAAMMYDSLSTWDALCQARGQHLQQPTDVVAQVMQAQGLAAPPRRPEPGSSKHPPRQPSPPAPAMHATATPTSAQSEDVRIDTPGSGPVEPAGAAPPPPIPSESPAVHASKNPPAAQAAPQGARGRIGPKGGARTASIVEPGGTRRVSAAGAKGRRRASSVAVSAGATEFEITSTAAGDSVTDDVRGTESDEDAFTLQSDSDAGGRAAELVVDELGEDDQPSFQVPSSAILPDAKSSMVLDAKSSMDASATPTTRKTNVLLLSQELGSASASTPNKASAMALLHRAAAEDRLSTSQQHAPPQPSLPQQPELSVSPKIASEAEPGATPGESCLSDEPKLEPPKPASVAGSAQPPPLPSPCSTKSERRVSLILPEGHDGSGRGSQGTADAPRSDEPLKRPATPPVPQGGGGKNVCMLSQELLSSNSPNAALALLNKAHTEEKGGSPAPSSHGAATRPPTPPSPRGGHRGNGKGKNVCMLSQELAASNSPNKALALLKKAHSHDGPAEVVVPDAKSSMVASGRAPMLSLLGRALEREGGPLGLLRKAHELDP
eukprot:TRINITY_DN6154_c0_g1_i1.p1 TRINITY_DN6154_c0_g1~~TRINITY_DN6154_c0_g1_i1.p1  ORF type:complete len:1085 (+),score=280.39 TRINITY_DN6154_c0_g1_i1:60-3314(+)